MRKFTFALPLVLVSTAFAGDATDQIKRTTADLRKLLEDPAMKGDAKKFERRRAIREIADTTFDWKDIVRRSLARNWSKLNAGQQDEFVRLFVEFLEASYLEKLEIHYSDLKEVLYRKERLVKGKYAMVECEVVTQKGVSHPVEFRLKTSDNRWKVYDLKIEGVSMVKNYRSQFAVIMKKSGYEGLVKTLRRRIEDAKKEA
ncbi:MAG: ABC transporter substrate-binding protein [Planctomycetota bacterium]|nr:ABC transporter substrate-binding protein [Planctomycetota bacterium]